MKPGSGAAAVPALKARALRALAQREYSRAELERKLQPHASDAAELAALLDALQSQGYLSDARFAAGLSRQRAPRQGVARIRAELRQRGVAAADVVQATAELAASEAERAQQAWQKKFGQPPATAQERARQLRFLLARGFAAECAARAVPRCSAVAGAVDDPEA